jgi:endonuclease/exonuclease/phosphatase (EEP) superfamily protein YafD
MNAARLQKFRGRLSALVWAGSWTYLALALIGALLIHGAGDSTWLMTLLTFGPRWMLLLPLAPLAVAAIAVCRKGLLPLLLGAGCAVGPVMGFCVPWRSALSAEPRGALSLRVVTLNIGDTTDIEKLIQFLKDVDPDIVAFQEGAHPPLLQAEFKHGWHTFGYGEVWLASREPIVNVAVAQKAQIPPNEEGWPKEERRFAPAIRCDIETHAGVVHVNCLHLYTLRKGLVRVIGQWWDGASELERVTAVRNEQSQLSASFVKAADGPTLVLGDFNMTSDSTVFRRDWNDWQDAFSTGGFGLGYTFATRRIGLRIDHVLADKRNWHVRSCRVGPDLEGQHRPVVADLLLLKRQ